MSLKKESTISINYKIKENIFKLLCEYAEESGRSKTSVIEDALSMYIDARRKDEELLKQYHEGKVEFIQVHEKTHKNGKSNDWYY